MLSAALLALPLAPAWAQPAGFDLDALMRLLAQQRSGEARFTERREILQLDQTLESSGRLSFSAADNTFVRETLRPGRERLAVVGNQLTMSRGGRSRSTPLDAVPEAVVIVEAIRGTLTGRRDTLERHFTLQLQGSAAQWQLELVPRDARLQGQVARVHLSGRQGQLREVRTTLGDGDRSVMRIEPLAAPADGTARP